MQLPSDVYCFSPIPESCGELPEEIMPQEVRVMTPKRAGPRKAPKEKKYECDLCAGEGTSRWFSRQPDLKRHKSSVHAKHKPFQCSWPGCKRSFSQKASLTTHKNTHTGAKPWECGTCHATFGDQSSCARHIREQHSGETHVCPHCNSTNKRASDFIHHMLASHNVEKTSVDLEKCRKLVEVSEKTPRLTPPGMPVRRSHPPSRARGVLPKRNEPVVVISGSEHEDTPFYDASQTCSSYPTTPASTVYSISPSPSLLEVGGGYSPQASPYVHDNNNALGMEFRTGVQTLWGNLHPISRTSSAASCLGDSRSPVLARPSSAPSFKTECHTPDFSATPGVEHKGFTSYPIGGSPYMYDSRGQVYYRTPETLLASYAMHGGQAMPYTREQLQHYLPGGLGISQTIRSRAHLGAWSSQESFK